MSSAVLTSPPKAAARLVVDTDVASFIFKWRPVFAPRYLSIIRGAELIVSFMTLAVMRQGALDANWGQRKWDLLEAYLADFSVLNSDNQVRNESARKGRQMSTADAWIAASALVLSAPLSYQQPQRLPPLGQPPTRFRCRLNRRHSEADRGSPGDRSSVVVSLDRKCLGGGKSGTNVYSWPRHLR